MNNLMINYSELYCYIATYTAESFYKLLLLCKKSNRILMNDSTYNKVLTNRDFDLPGLHTKVFNKTNMRWQLHGPSSLVISGDSINLEYFENKLITAPNEIELKCYFTKIVLDNNLYDYDYNITYHDNGVPKIYGYNCRYIYFRKDFTIKKYLIPCGFGIYKTKFFNNNKPIMCVN
jgi:hypothetical protein